MPFFECEGGRSPTFFVQQTFDVNIIALVVMDNNHHFSAHFIPHLAPVDNSFRFIASCSKTTVTYGFSSIDIEWRVCASISGEMGWCVNNQMQSIVRSEIFIMCV
jgi:hypothetical protein